MPVLRSVIVACGVFWGLALNGAASAEPLHLHQGGLHLGARFGARLGPHFGVHLGAHFGPHLGPQLGAPLGVHLHEPDLHLQQQGICSVLGGPCHPSFCSVFGGGPCIPYYWPPLGENLQLTITTTDDNDPASSPASNKDGGAEQNSGAADKNAPDKNNDQADKNSGDMNKDADNTDQAQPKAVDTIGEMFAALRACWVPPPKDEARHGMQYTVRFSFKRDGKMVGPPFVTYVSHDAPADARNVYRDAIDEALNRCMPLHFTDGMAGAVVGRPIAVRFVDNRTSDKSVH
jgi:hypothetical protein